MEKKKYDPPPDGWMYIWRKWITDPKTGERRYRRNGKAWILLVPVSEI